MAAAERHNAAGNAAYKEGRYQEAEEHYSEAIKADVFTAKYRTNRANALWK
jgi:tetratricopeptide (TPR) repeat protein